MNKLSPPTEEAYKHWNRLASWKAKAVYLTLLEARTLAELSISYSEVARFTKELSQNAKMLDEIVRVTLPMRKGLVATEVPIKVSLEQELDDADWNQ